MTDLLVVIFLVAATVIGLWLVGRSERAQQPPTKVIERIPVEGPPPKMATPVFPRDETGRFQVEARPAPTPYHDGSDGARGED